MADASWCWIDMKSQILFGQVNVENIDSYEVIFGG